MFDVTEGFHDAPLIRQLSVFLPNRVGALLSVTRTLDTLGLSLCALAIADAADHAVARLVVDRPELARDALEADGHAVVETDLVGVALPPGRAGDVRRVLHHLLMAEMNVNYLYTFAAPVSGQGLLALFVEDVESAARVLREGGFELVGQDELS